MRIRSFLTSALLFFSVFFSSAALANTVDIPYAGRNFKLVIPDHPGKGTLPLLLMLHGCKQDASILLQGTGMEAEAKKGKFMVLVPEQSILHNPDHCWNWFLPFEQQRFSSTEITTEMGQIISFIDWMMPFYSIDRERVFVAGMSAGGAMAHAFLACYPDYFKGVAVHSGLAFKVAESIDTAESVLLSQTQKSPEYLGEKAYECGRVGGPSKVDRLIILHGADDPRVLPLHASLTLASSEVMFDFRDDGQRNNSVQIVRSSSTQNYPNGYVAEITDSTVTSTGGTIFERIVFERGLVHAWGIAGTTGKAVSANFDPLAPSSNAFILEYFGLLPHPPTARH